MSDLLHFDGSRDVLLSSLTSLLLKSPEARTYVAAGIYTAPHVCNSFLRHGETFGLEWKEEAIDLEEGWIGQMAIKGPGLDLDGLKRRKAMVRLWIGKWTTVALNTLAADGEK